MLRGAQSPSSAAPSPPQPPSHAPATEAFGDLKPATRKRKAESQDNERLSKRLSLLNIEHNGSKLYVPVETPSARAAQTHPAPAAPDDGNGMMQVDDSKHKVYIYNIDDELSSDSDGEDGRLVFLPDIDKHLQLNRIPRHVLVNDDGELAGMQMVLYSDPRSLTVPEDKDGVRKAVIEARRRVREKQRLEREEEQTPADDATGKPAPDEDPADGDSDAMELD